MLSSESLRPNIHRKALGKLATRLEEVKNPWRQVSTLELSHNEAARLATDALLESGEKEYRRVLTEERELNFLSPLEIQYITDSATKNVSDSSGANGSEREFGEADAVSELTSGTYFPMMSDEDAPALELGWPDLPTRYGPSETQIYFQRDKSHNVKDLIRSLINKAKKVIAIVMDLFTDVDLLCDLMEASNKRKVPVYILLDSQNLDYFKDMCIALDIRNSHLSNMRIRSVCGETYCTKSGKKFTGQVQEKFMIIDCEEVIAGSYSFSWLSGQVHSNMLLHFSGRIAERFDCEFRCLYADSQIIDYFYNPDEEGLPFYAAFPPMLPVTGPRDFQDRVSSRERLGSDSSSQSSSSLSSVKMAPGMAATVYQVTDNNKEANSPFTSPERRGSQNSDAHTQGPERWGGQSPMAHSQGSEKREGQSSAPHSQGSDKRGGQGPTPHTQGLERRGVLGPAPHTQGLERRGVQGPTPHTQGLERRGGQIHVQGGHAARGFSNANGHSASAEWASPVAGQTGLEWNKAETPDYLRGNLGGTTSKVQGLNLYDHKPNYFHSGMPKTNPQMDTKMTGKHKNPTNPLLNKISDFFQYPYKERETYNLRRSPPQSTAFGGPDLTQAEPESQQPLPPPPPLSPEASPTDVGMNRQDAKRMTLGHSKLDLVNHYNKMKSKHIYSRFELKNNNT
ncbi:protein FAM83C [Anguilla anguilla]|uniref:protein FAM83C n=1 Tax=Anguilla anguilla TaxID=7936 RepID=UPI0015B363B4|nr:protein FAM83C [Anguilla anguilla]